MSSGLGSHCDGWDIRIAACTAPLHLLTSVGSTLAARKQTNSSTTSAALSQSASKGTSEEHALPLCPDGLHVDPQIWKAGTCHRASHDLCRATLMGVRKVPVE